MPIGPVKQPLMGLVRAWEIAAGLYRQHHRVIKEAR